MRQLALKSGAELITDRGESSGRLAPHLPDPLTVWNEAFDNAKSIAIASVRLQRNRILPQS